MKQHPMNITFLLLFIKIQQLKNETIRKKLESKKVFESVLKIFTIETPIGTKLYWKIFSFFSALVPSFLYIHILSIIKKKKNFEFA